MTLNVPSLPADNLLEQAVDLAEEGVASAAENVGSIAERVSRLQVGEELRSAAGRAAGEADALLDELDGVDRADSRALLAAAVVTAVLTLAMVLIARRRRVQAANSRDA